MGGRWSNQPELPGGGGRSCDGSGGTPGGGGGAEPGPVGGILVWIDGGGGPQDWSCAPGIGSGASLILTAFPQPTDKRFPSNNKASNSSYVAQRVIYNRSFHMS